MATAHMPDEFFDLVAHHLPPERPVGPNGGRPRVGHRVVVRVLWFVLATGCRREDVPAELGCSGRTANRRLRAGRGWGCGTGYKPTCSDSRSGRCEIPCVPDTWYSLDAVPHRRREARRPSLGGAALAQAVGSLTDGGVIRVGRGRRRLIPSGTYLACVGPPPRRCLATAGDEKREDLLNG